MQAFRSIPLAFWSPPSRAAWIEMEATESMEEIAVVAAFTGGVD